MSVKHGEITQMAKKAGISVTHMADILRADKTPSPNLAVRLEKITGISRSAWLFPDEYPNPMIRNSQEADDGESRA